jgi:osmoprotectant transport system permease protein
MRGARHMAFIAALAVVAALSSASAQPHDTVVIGSKAFTESRLLAEITAQLLAARTSLKVEQRAGLGGTNIVFGALQNGEIDLYPEYTGTGWTVLLADERRVNDSLRAFLMVRREFLKRWQLEWLPPYGFNNSYALAMAESKAEALGVQRISDLLPHQAELSAGVTHEFLERADGFRGLAEAYGLKLGEVKGMEHGLAYEAIATGKIDLIDTYTTDGKLEKQPVRLLEDDRNFFPPYDAAPLVRKELLDRHPEVRDVLEELSFRIDDAQMRRLNHRVEAEGGDFAKVARDLLVEEGLLEASTAASDTNEATQPGLLGFLWKNRGSTMQRIGEHLMLTLIAVLLAIVVSVPVGIGLTRREKLAAPVLGATGVIQTVPSLALLAFMIPVPGLGLGTRSAVAALFLYALLPIVRNTYTGIREVDPDLVEAARAMGLTPRQILWHVQLPLATRTIMAGIRTSTVISIGVATLAAFIGGGGLGDPIVTGLQLDNINMVLSGAIPAALLAILADGGLGRLERRLVPKGLR